MASSAQSYYFRHYQVEQGLSNNTVFCSAQDKRGFLWMGTKDGLNRFDGYSFKVFRSDPDDSSSLGDGFIRSIYIDANDILYVGTRIGIYRYNAITETFKTIVRTTEEIRDIKKDGGGRLWFIAGKTLRNYDETTQKQAAYPNEKYFSATSLCIDQNGFLWVSSDDGLLYKYDNLPNTFTAHALFSGVNHSASKWIEKIYATDQESILVGTSNYGVKLFNLKDFRYKDILTINPDQTEIFARDFAQISGSEFWIATESGVYIFNTLTGGFTNLRKQYDNPYSISDNAVYTLCRDKEGGIWAGTYFGGINYFPKQYASFEKLFPGYNLSSLSGNAVREICEDKFGNLWIGTEDAGLNLLDRKTGSIRQFKPSGLSEDISYPNIHGLLAKGDELWIGTFEHGLDVMDIKKGKVIKHYPGNNAQDLKSNFFVVIYQTTKGQIYAGTRQGLYRFNNTRNDFDVIAQIPTHCFIHSIKEDRNGNLWVGTLGNGVFFYNLTNGRSKNFVYSRGDKTGLTSNSVTTIFESDDHDLWFGTEGGGLCKFNPGDSSFTSYTLKEGFPSNTIFKIMADGRQVLWITTSTGLVSFSPKTKKIVVYTTANGLLSNQFNYNSGYKDGTGKMYFGSAKGLISFNPDSFKVNKFIPPIFITGLFINGQELAIQNNGSPLKKSITYTEKIHLSYRQSSFTIDFAALTFTAPEMTEYMYMMEGLEKDWTYLKTNRKVYFTNVPPGNYTFKVKAANSSGLWTQKPAALEIHIDPPFWASTLAYIFYGLLAGSILFYLFRAYHKRLNEKTKRKLEFLEHEKEKQIYHAKIEFFTSIAHEIKTPLTLIKAPMEQIIKKAGENVDFAYDLKIMERNTDKLIELSSQLLDFRKIEATGFQLNFARVNIADLLLERYNSFNPLAEQKNIDLTIQVPAEPVIAHIDVDCFQKIINNLLYNALNYGESRAGIKLLFLRENDNFFVVEFNNDGHLIPAEMSERIFEPFYRLKETQNKSGSGIGLALSRSLVDLHKGSLSLKASTDDMNTFVLVMPVNQN